MNLLVVGDLIIPCHLLREEDWRIRKIDLLILSLLAPMLLSLFQKVRRVGALQPSTI